MLAVCWWINAGAVIYVYFGYPALLWGLSRARASRSTSVVNDAASSESVGRISLIIASRNEEKQIAGKLKNSLALDFPRNELEIVVVSDGSIDRTADIVRQYAAQDVRLVDLRENVGKAAAQNEATKQATGEILVFSDADVLLEQEALRKLVRHFSNRDVGCVTSRVAYVNEDETSVTRGEGLYWRYEVGLREHESRVGNLTAGSGAAIAVRRSLFEPLDSGVSEDFFLPMRAAIRGYRTVFEPEAVARTPLQQARPREMFGTRTRTIMLDARSVWLCRAILDPVRYPLYALGVMSHKVLRWLVPYFLLGLLAANVMLLGRHFYDVTFSLQMGFYAAALAGYWWQRKGRPLGMFGIPFFFCLVNLAALVGVARFITGGTSEKWAPVRS